jgi:hypothetical protein
MNTERLLYIVTILFGLLMVIFPNRLNKLVIRFQEKYSLKPFKKIQRYMSENEDSVKNISDRLNRTGNVPTIIFGAFFVIIGTLFLFGIIHPR